MFEDVLKARPNVAQEIKDLLVGQVEKAFAHKIDKEHDEEILRAMYKFKEAMDDKLDDFAKLYTEHFTTEEMIVLLDWSKSDLGMRAEEFNAEKIIPQCLEMLQDVIDEMVDEDMKKDEELFDACLAERTRLQKERMDKIDEDNWEVEVELEDE